MDLSDTVALLMTEGKGILVLGGKNEIEDERLAAFGAAGADARRAYHELLFTTPGIEEHLSAVILSSDSLQEKTSDGALFPALLVSKKISVGVSLDAQSMGEEKFSETLQGYRSAGVTFAALTVSTPVSNEPVSSELHKNIQDLAGAAKALQAEGVVPLLSVDASMYGTHSATEAEDTILEMLSLLADALKEGAVSLQDLIVGVSMTVSGSDNPARADAAEVAERSVRVLTTAISDKAGGVVFLSDAQNPEEGTANLNALARLEPLPWPIAFCFSGVLNEPVLAAWKGSEENIPDAQAVFEERLSLLSRADAAGYGKGMEEV